MTRGHLIECVACKVTSLGIIVSAIAFTPVQIAHGARPTPFNITTMVFFSALFLWAGWRGLLRTNNPATRLNPLSLNRRWRPSMDGPVIHQPLDEPTEDDLSELRRRRRARRIKKAIG